MVKSADVMGYRAPRIRATPSLWDIKQGRARTAGRGLTLTLTVTLTLTLTVTLAHRRAWPGGGGARAGLFRARICRSSSYSCLG